MSKTQPITEGNTPNDLECPHCKTLLPSYALFCSFCGMQVVAKKNEEKQKHTENEAHNAREQDDDTVRMASISQKHLKRWQAFQSLKDTKPLEQPHLNGPLPQDAEAPTSPLLETVDPRTKPVDARAQTEAPIPIELLQSLPTTPIPAIPKIWQQVPVTEVPISKPSLSNRLWPIIIILSAVAASLVNFVFTDIAIRPAIVFWFLFVCPGMAIVRFLRLKEPAIEWTLALALSFTIDALVAGIQLYAGKWSPTITLVILIGLSLGGAIVQLVTIGSTAYMSTLSHALHSRKLMILLAILLALLMGLGVVVGFWSQRHSHSSHSPVRTVTLHSSGPTRAPTSVVTNYPLIAGTYHGTIDDLSSNVSTSLSITGVRQNRGKISGYLILGSRLQGSGPFKGTLDTTKHFQFTVTDAAGHATLFFEGVMQSPTNLSGDYYKCSPTRPQNNQCSQVPGSYGIWSATLAS